MTTTIKTTRDEPISNAQGLRVLAFVIVVVPLLVPLNIVAWRVATGAW